MKISHLFSCWAVLATGSLLAQTPAEEDLFPFVIPGLTAPPAGSVVDVSWLNERPAGGHGFVRARLRLPSGSTRGDRVVLVLDPPGELRARLDVHVDEGFN